MADLAGSFGSVADAYERGRPRYDSHVIAVVGQAAGGPRILDVGAGTGRLSAPLLQAGYDVVAVEPLDGMRAILAEHIGPERARDGRAEQLPLADASVDGAVCSDAWHWFDGARAADELARVVKPGGGVVICISLSGEEDGEAADPWAQELGRLWRELMQAFDHPSADGSFRPDGFDGHPAFEELQMRNVPFVHHTDRGRIVAHFASMSFVSSLPDDRRAEALGRVDRILARHGIDRVDVPYRAELWITRRRRAQAPPAGRAEAAS
jgi:SAM-dependent methyltransferase